MHISPTSPTHTSQDSEFTFDRAVHNPNQALPVKSISVGNNPPSAAFSHVQLSLDRIPHAHVVPAGLTFSLDARSQVHWPAGLAPGGERQHRSDRNCNPSVVSRGGEAGDLRHEHRAPVRVFSVVFLSQVQFMADCLPQEQVALEAQTQLSDRPQQVVGLTILDGFGCVGGCGAGRLS